MSDRKAPDALDDLLSDTLLKMAQSGLVKIDGDNIAITPKGLAVLEKARK